jgi:DNA primase large subunit
MQTESVSQNTVTLTRTLPLTQPVSYDQPPMYDVTIEDFETTALDRLRVLADIESSAARSKTWDETKASIKAQCTKYLRLTPPSHDPVEQDALRSRDHIGHYVLRLAFCRS